MVWFFYGGAAVPFTWNCFNSQKAIHIIAFSMLQIIRVITRKPSIIVVSHRATQNYCSFANRQFYSFYCPLLCYSLTTLLSTYLCSIFLLDWLSRDSLANTFSSHEFIIAPLDFDTTVLLSTWCVAREFDWAGTRIWFFFSKKDIKIVSKIKSFYPLLVVTLAGLYLFITQGSFYGKSHYTIPTVMVLLMLFYPDPWCHVWGSISIETVTHG